MKFKKITKYLLFKKINTIRSSGKSSSKTLGGDPQSMMGSQTKPSYFAGFFLDGDLQSMIEG
jgi:hypothetical protein